MSQCPLMMMSWAPAQSLCPLVATMSHSLPDVHEQRPVLLPRRWLHHQQCATAQAASQLDSFGDQPLPLLAVQHVLSPGPAPLYPV